MTHIFVFLIFSESRKTRTQKRKVIICEYEIIIQRHLFPNYINKENKEKVLFLHEYTIKNINKIYRDKRVT